MDKKITGRELNEQFVWVGRTGTVKPAFDDDDMYTMLPGGGLIFEGKGEAPVSEGY